MEIAGDIAARRLADHAMALGAESDLDGMRMTIPPFRHLGALMADAILQAGLSYMSTVRPRVERIMADPATEHLDGVVKVVREGRTGEFLDWTHHEKIGRFEGLAEHFDREWIGTVETLHARMGDADFREGLLELRGVGPKTRDYIGALCGRNDVVAVDRHIVAFAEEAGAPAESYGEMAEAFIEAAGILDVPPRNFDSWVWRRMSSRGGREGKRG